MTRRSPRSSPKGKSKEVSERTKEGSVSASWTSNDIDFLIDQVIARRAEGGDGMNFKKSFWQSLAASDLLSNLEKGGPKTSSSCKEKWSRLKKTFEAVDHLVNFASGLTYSLELGANIGVENESVWTDYIKHHPAASPFRNKGWPFYDKMKLVMPSKSKGANRFSALAASSSSQPAPSLSRSATTSDSENAEHSVGGAVAATESTDAGMEPCTIPDSRHDARPPSSEVSAAASTRPPSSIFTCLTPSHFTPPPPPSSFTSSLASSIKPSSSISARVNDSNKRKADDDDTSMVSVGVTSHSAVGVGSSHSSQKRRTATIPAAIDRVGDHLGSLNDTFRDSVAAVETIASNVSVPPSRRALPSTSTTAETETPKSAATSRLLTLDLPTLSPAQTVAIIDCVQNNPESAKTYLTLAADTSEMYMAVRKAWIMKRLEEAGVANNM
ncbi:hypothetical protein EDD15DRAFT_2378298 [Pisolithus albus]|nr:hypothetical protein EDD15DRAFT_2378298 [Pisolithus albus]